MARPPPGSTLFPYTTLFRSVKGERDWISGGVIVAQFEPQVRAGVKKSVLRRFLRSEETRLNSSHSSISYAVFCLKKKKLILHILHVTELVLWFLLLQR